MWPLGTMFAASRSDCRRRASGSPAGLRRGACGTKASYGSGRSGRQITKRWASARPAGPILGARVEHLGIKEALIAEGPEVYFTTPHFDGYPAVLVRLDAIAADDLEEVIVDAWFARAPKRLAQEYADSL